MIAIALHQVSAAEREARIEFSEGQRVAFSHGPECGLPRPARSLTQQVDRLGERRPGREERELELFKRAATNLVIRLTGVDQRDQRAGVGERQDLRRVELSISVNAAPDRLATPPVVWTAPITSSS